MKKQFFLLLFLLVGTFAVAQPVVSIDSIRITGSNMAPGDTSLLNGQLVKTTGMVITPIDDYYQTPIPPNSEARYSFWIVNPVTKRGLQIYLWDGTLPIASDVAALAVGTTVEITAVVDYFAGTIQLSLDTSAAVIDVIATGGTLPTPIPITADVLNDGMEVAQPTGNQYEGSYVEIVQATVTFGTTDPARGSFEVQQNGGVINIWDAFMFMRNRMFPGALPSGVVVPLGATYDTIRGIVSHRHFPTGNPPSDRYEIWPITAADLVVGEAPPTISNMTRSVVCPNDQQSITITATVVSTVQGQVVDTVVLLWATNVNPTSWSAVPMTAGPSNTYTATIPAQPNGTLVSYYVRAQELDLGSPLTADFPWHAPSCYGVNNSGCQIFDIQRVPNYRFSISPRWLSGYEGLTVTNVPAVITAVFDEGSPASGYRVVAQQPGQNIWAGIDLIGASSLYSLNVGDSILITSADVAESFGLTQLNVATFTPLGSVAAIAALMNPELLTFANNGTGSDTMGYAQERYESMLIGWNQPGQIVVNNAVDNFYAWRVGLDQFSPNAGVRILTGRKTTSVFSSLDVSYVSNDTLANVDGVMQVPACEVSVGDSIGSFAGIWSFSFNQAVLMPRMNADFSNVSTPCGGGSVSTAEAFAADRVTVYPNPTSGSLTFRFDAPKQGGYNVRVADLLGRTVVSQNLQLAGDEARLDLGSLNNGTYVVVLTDANGAKNVSRVVVVR